jgi:hypothetical protein
MAAFRYGDQLSRLDQPLLSLAEAALMVADTQNNRVPVPYALIAVEQMVHLEPLAVALIAGVDAADTTERENTLDALRLLGRLRLCRVLQHQ